MPSLELINLSKRFGERQALDGISFSVEAGEIFGFVGSNGAGKTTTMRAILGVLSLDFGEIEFGGRPIDASDRAHFGYMPEERGLYPKMRVSDQLVYLARLHGLSRTDAVTAMEQWTERLNLTERRGDTVDALSLGNQQRVQLAAALMHSPTMLVLDEPFSGLDPLAVTTMSDSLRSIATTGVPVLFSSHQLQLVEDISDRVGIIAQGRMVAVGTVEELRSTQSPRYFVRSVGLTGDWLDVPGARVIEAQDDGSLVELDDASLASTVLAQAVASAPVSEFSRVKPRLTELYREVVSA